MICDATFRVISAVCLIGIVAATVLHFLVTGRKVRAGGPSGGKADVRRLGFIERIVFLGFALTLLCLAVTGFSPNLLEGERLEEWLLMLHVGAGGGFLFFLLLLSVVWAEDCRFREHDALWCCACCNKPGEPAPAGRFDAGQKFTFWAALALAAGAAISILVSMLPIFGTAGLEVLRDIHRTCGLLFVLIGYVHVYQTVVVRRGRLRWLLSGKVSSEWARHYHPLWWQIVEGKEVQ